MHSPLSRQISAPVDRLVAQHPLCFALALHGAKVSSSFVPSTPKHCWPAAMLKMAAKREREVAREGILDRTD